MGGPGAPGTITAIQGSTLTLRTMNGTETVDTSSATTFTKELQTISLSDLHIGDVVQVVGTPASNSSSDSSSSSRARSEPGTGILAATRVAVIEPTFMGRVISRSGATYTLAGPEGQLLSVTTSGSTRYYRGTSEVSSLAISSGSRIMVEGTQQTLTSLRADLITLAPPAPSLGRHVAPGSSPVPRPRAPTTTPSRAPSSSSSSTATSVQGS
jgi:hypothetical protein